MNLVLNKLSKTIFNFLMTFRALHRECDAASGQLDDTTFSAR